MALPFDPVKLKEGLNIQELLRGNSQTLVLSDDEDEFHDVPDLEKRVDTFYEYDDYKDHINFDVVKAGVEGLSETPFEAMALNMTSVTPDGKVKKRIVEPGKEPVPKNGIVYVNYDFYLEMQEVPIDSSHLRTGKPERFQLGKGHQIRGFDIAVSSMSVGEKSHFLIHYDYAFLKTGVPSRIPPEADILAVIELVDAVDCGTLVEEKELTPEELRSYAAVFPRAEAEHKLANHLYRKRKVGGALYHYHAGMKLLTGCIVPDSEQVEWKELLFKIYLNMAICYNRQNKGCSRALDVLEKALSINRDRAVRCAKFFYNRAVARDAKGDYQQAFDDLDKAGMIEPNNPEISARRASLAAKLMVANDLELRMAKKAFGAVSKSEKPVSIEITEHVPDDELTEDFKQKMIMPAETANSTTGARAQRMVPSANENPANPPAESLDTDDALTTKPLKQETSVEESAYQYLMNFKNSPSSFHNLGYGFTPSERLIYKELCERLGLFYVEHRGGPLRREVHIRKIPEEFLNKD